MERYASPRTLFWKYDERKNRARNKFHILPITTEQFGSYDNWLKDFKATGTMRGIGWTILYRDNETNKLFNVWVNEHDLGHLVGASPLLVLDVFEHAYTLDYGLKRADYIEAFVNAIDWNIVASR